MAAESPLQQVNDMVTYTIKVNGNEISAEYEVFEITIEKAINKIPTAIIRMEDGDIATQEYPATNSPDFAPGTEIEILAGYNTTNTTIFSGIITSQRVALDDEEGIVLELTCKDKAIKMTGGRKNAYFDQMSDSDAISQIIQAYGLTADVDTTTVQNKELVQYYATDWDFMMIRADINGLFALVDQGTVAIKKPDFSTEPAISLTSGIDIIEFNAELNSTSQFTAATGTSWDYATQAIIQANGENPAVNSQGDLQSADLSKVMGITNYQLQSFGSVAEDDLKVWASTQLLKAQLARITGSVTFNGVPNVNPGNQITLNGVSKRFNGNAYVSGITHHIADGAWNTTADFGLEEEWFSQKPFLQNTGASGLVPSVSGLMNGVVKQLDQDPDGEFRIQLTLPLMQDAADGIWARMSTFYATSGKGIFFIPEVGDEVIVGFLNNDPRFPIVLGSLYSSGRTSPNPLTKENYTKAIITNSDCKIAFDDENKIITITTPGNNQMVYSDKDKGITITDENNNKIQMGTDGITIQDKNNNKITMSSNGIELESPSDINLKATGNIVLKSTGNTEISATGNCTAAGIGISLSANGEFKASGMASSEVSTSGIMTVKGSMVMIN